MIVSVLLLQQSLPYEQPTMINLISSLADLSLGTEVEDYQKTNDKHMSEAIDQSKF